ncbi:MAG: acetyl-CoA carboxylase biotin carboxyl carrier protein subunit [Candidatus Glassbacteria bacterium]
MTTSFRLDGKRYDLDISEGKEGLFITIDGRSSRVDYHWISEHELSIIIEGKSFIALINRVGSSRSVTIEGEHYLFEMIDEAEEATGLSQDTARDKLSSPMPGNVIKVKVKAGDEVKKGTSLVIVEAMKMENEIRAPYDSIVRKVLVKEGEVVDAGAPLVDLKAVKE